VERSGRKVRRPRPTASQIRGRDVKTEQSRVDLGGGLREYMTKADETFQELQASDAPCLRVLLQYDEYLRHDLWEHAMPSPFSVMLFFNAYQLYLAGIRMALSGHPAAVFPLMRTALESASYGFLLEQEPALSKIWLNRHRSEADKKACRKAFTFEKAIAGVVQKAPDIYRLAKEAYDGAIDYGAHPNLRGVLGHITLDESRPDGMTAVVHASLYGTDHPETIVGLCACLDFGFLIIGIVAIASPTPGETLAAELQALNAAKNAAVDSYRAPS
jgi:hypothetical protein